MTVENETKLASRMTQRRWQLAIFLVAATASAPISAGALKIWTYPSTACRYYAPVAGDTYFSPSGYAANGLKNTATSAKNLTCPLTLTQGNGEKIRQADIGISSNQGSCELWWRWYSGGATTFWSQTSVEPGYNGGYLYKMWSPSSYFDCTNGSCSVFCSIPAGANTAAYRDQTLE